MDSIANSSDCWTRNDWNQGIGTDPSCETDSHGICQSDYFPRSDGTENHRDKIDGRSDIGTSRRRPRWTHSFPLASMKLPRRVPWVSISELDHVCSWIFADNSDTVSKTLAVNRVCSIESLAHSSSWSDRPFDAFVPSCRPGKPSPLSRMRSSRH